FPDRSSGMLGIGFPLTVAGAAAGLTEENPSHRIPFKPLLGTIGVITIDKNRGRAIAFATLTRLCGRLTGNETVFFRQRGRLRENAVRTFEGSMPRLPPQL